MTDSIIKTLGAGSGIDTTNLISQLVAIERAPTEERLDRREARLEAQISGYGLLKSSLDGLKGSLTALSGSDLFNARTVAVPNSDVITANAVQTGAQTGTYQIEVLEVASAQSLVMASQSERDTALGKSGELTIRFGEWSYDINDEPETFAINDQRAALSIDIETTDSLDAIAAKINAEDAGVQASVLKVESSYQLMLTSPSGKSNALEITGDDASLDDLGFSAGAVGTGVTETQQAQDAQIKVNGLAVSRESNDIDDVIQGFDFTLNKASPGETVSFSITSDKSLAEQAVRDFVTAYNSYHETAENLVGYSRDENNDLVRGDLAGDSSARTLISRLREMIGAAVPGVGSGFSALTNIGIRTELDGSLSISEDEFSSAIDENFGLVEHLFAANTSSANSAVSVNMGSYAGAATGGTYEVEITQDPTQGSIQGNAITASFATPLDTSSGDYSFKIQVNGVESALIQLTGTYATPDELRADLQTLINGDENLKAGFAEVDVAYDAGSNSFSFVSREYGSVSEVGFSQASGDMATLGVETALTGTAGMDVEGKVEGVEGFGTGDLLLPDIDSPIYGLNFSVGSGASAQGAFEINFSRGFAGELSRLIDGFLSSSGTVKMREDSIQSQLDDLDEDRAELDRRMEAYQERLVIQYTAMERIVSSFQTTGGQLEGLVDRLPYTAKG